MSIFAFTVTRASTPARCKLLIETITAARKTAGVEFDWHVWESGCSPDGIKTLEAALAAEQITDLHLKGENIGQHIAWNEAFDLAHERGYDYFLRLDDDCEFISKRWLKKLVYASTLFNDKFIISPTIKGLNYPPDRSSPCIHLGQQIEFLRAAIGGICRLHPVALLHERGFIADVRKPLGSGDATGIGTWCKENTIPMVYLKRVRVRHAKSTTVQEREDPDYFQHHDIFQHIPYIPRYVATEEAASV